MSIANPLHLRAIKHRPLDLIPRRDLQCTQAVYQGRDVVVVKDPLALRYFQLRPDEYFVLQQLRKESTLSELHAAYRAEYPSAMVTEQEIQRLLERLFQYGLVTSERGLQGTQLWQRHHVSQNQRLHYGLSNPLVIRLPGFNPDPLLAALYRHLGFLYSPVALALQFLLILTAFLFVLTHMEALVDRIPSFDATFSRNSVLYFMLAIGGCKVIHEFAHGLTCKHFGGACHEMGVILLFFTPALYCDTSDSWMLPNRWQRVAVAAAGVWSEWLLAALATWIWWWTVDGWVNDLALRVMIVCSISTLLINGNPLLRYDGYYILSDLWGVPNLASQARQSLKAVFSPAQANRSSDARPPRVDQRIGLPLYAVASAIYRWTITLAILWFIWRIWRPLGMQSIGAALALITIVALLIPLVGRVFRTYHARRRQPISNHGRPFPYSLLALLMLIGLMFVPLPRTVVGPSAIHVQDAHPVYATVSGIVCSIRAVPGQQVEKGDLLFQLEQPELRKEWIEFTGKVERQRLQVQLLEQTRFTDRQSDDQLPAARALLMEFEQQLMERTAKLEALSIRAHISGRIQSAPRRPPYDDSSSLPVWSGSTLDPTILGASIETGTILCRIVSEDAWQAECMIAEDSADSLKKGAGAIVFGSSSRPPVIAHITQIDPVTVESPSDSNASELHTNERVRAPRRFDSDVGQTDRSGYRRLRLSLEMSGHTWVDGEGAWCRIRLPSLPLWKRAYLEMLAMVRRDR